MSWRILDEWIRVCGPRLENYLPAHSQFILGQHTRLNAKSKQKSRRKLRKVPAHTLQGQLSGDSDENTGAKPRQNPPGLSIKIYEFLHVLVNTHPKSDIVSIFPNGSCA